MALTRMTIKMQCAIIRMRQLDSTYRHGMTMGILYSVFRLLKYVQGLLFRLKLNIESCTIFVRAILLMQKVFQ